MFAFEINKKRIVSSKLKCYILEHEIETTKMYIFVVAKTKI